MLEFLGLILLVFLGSHWAFMLARSFVFHPIHALIEVLLIYLLFHLVMRVIDKHTAATPPKSQP